MKKLLVVAAVVLGLAGMSHAGTKEDLAKEIVKLTDLKKVAGQVAAQIGDRQTEQLNAVLIPKEREADEAALLRKIKGMLEDTMSWEKMEQEYAKFLADTYTEEELKAIQNFCSSPVGLAILKKEPIIMGKVMLMTQSRVETILPEIKKMVRDFKESIKRVK
jgi:hypothetical protein